ncbi:MAG: hypothetical protein H0X65_04770 [Gemmatimonadetes bacterium]|nr:hypothetical protein [Gemmatimonadota bacterium]
MRSLLRLLFATLLLWVVSPSSLSAQVNGARIAPRGTAQISVGATFATHDSRFGSVEQPESGERQPLGTPFNASLTSETFVPLQPLQAELNRVLMLPDGEAATIANPGNLFLSAATLHTAADHRSVPIGIEIGVLPRVSLGVRLPLTQQWLSIQGMGVGEGTVGVNPDPTHNSAVLRGVDTTFAAFGGGHLLPTRDSELGRALQARVRNAGVGGELRLPEQAIAAVGITGFAAADEIGTGRHTPGRPAWGLGDLELSARLQLLDSRPVAEGPGAGYRVALELGLRLPTGAPAGADYLVLPLPDEGLFGLVVGLQGDVALSPRFGASLATRWESLGSVEVERRRWLPVADSPPAFVDDTIRWDAGARGSLLLAPWIRLVDEITVFSRYAYSLRAGESYGTVSAVPAEGQQMVLRGARSAQEAGLGIEYSTLPAFFAGRAGLPMEVSLLVQQSFAGSGGAPAVRAIQMQARIYIPLWGR